MAESAYTIIAKRAGDWWVGWVQEIPGVNAQEHTKEELILSLRHAVREAIEMNRNEARKAAEF
jgi:predicted RNase H-like HicB family nuclease